MPFTEIRGDLFQVPGLNAIAHGVNTMGKMGAGIADKFRIYFPEMFRQYRGLCQTGQLRPGGLFPYWHFPRKQWVYNLATQPRTGACAKLEYIELAVLKMLEHAPTHNVNRIGICQIGCGYGGLSYEEDVRHLLVSMTTRSHIELVVAIWTPR